MIDKKYILFDLDGTLTNPYEGITKSVQHALSHFGIEEKQENLKMFIGPPLAYSFSTFYGFDKEKTKEAIRKYRERFSVKGIHENEIIEGIPQLLKELKDNGKHLILATSKPIEFASQIVENFELSQYFVLLAGSTFSGERNTKAKVIAYALEKAGVKDLSQAIMIGDREHDIIGAKENGIESIGVLFGFGSWEEFKKAGAEYICETVDDLKKLLL